MRLQVGPISSAITLMQPTSGSLTFPSKEEAEYTASLAFDCSLRFLAARMGLAKLHVPRFLFVETAGRREHWLHIDPRALREWAMAPTAISLTAEASGGCHSRGQDLAAWGRLCGDAATTAIISQLPSGALRLSPVTIATRPLGFPSTWSTSCSTWQGTFRLVFGFGRPPPRARKKRQAGASGQVRQVLAAVTGLPPTVGAVIPYWSQEAVVAAFCSLYPPHYFENFCFPMVEDLVNQPPFTCFTQRLRSRGLCWDGPLVPMLASPQQRLLARTAEGQQPGRCRGRQPAPRYSRLGSLASSALSTAWLERTSRCRQSNHP